MKIELRAYDYAMCFLNLLRYFFIEIVGIEFILIQSS